MTSRGNSSISPPVQISVQSQPRQVTAFSSGTPPPQQQYFPGQAQIPQGVFEYHAQNHQGQQQAQPLLPHQAYGSAPNDIRVSGGSGRVAPPQQGIPQSGAYYQQPGQTMRPQAPQTQGYFLSTPQRPQRPPQQYMAFPLQPGFTPGANVIIPAQNFHQRVPLFVPQPQGPTQYSRGPGTYQMYNYPNGQMVTSGPMMTQGVPRQGPPTRERRLIEIKDPATGRSITEEICNRPQSADGSEPMVEPQVPQTNEVAQEFVSRVAEMLKPSGVGGTGAAAPMEASQTSVETWLSQQPSQQMPPPQQPQQTPQVAPNMIRPPTQHPHMMPAQNAGMHPHNMMPPHSQPMMGQQSSSGTPPEMMAAGRPAMSAEVLKVNLAVPPPAIPQQVRQPSPAQIFVPQQQSHAASQPQTAPQQQVLATQHVQQQQHHAVNQQNVMQQPPQQQHHVPQQPTQPPQTIPQQPSVRPPQVPAPRPQIPVQPVPTTPPPQQVVVPSVPVQPQHGAPSVPSVPVQPQPVPAQPQAPQPPVAQHTVPAQSVSTATKTVIPLPAQVEEVEAPSVDLVKQEAPSTNSIEKAVEDIPPVEHIPAKPAPPTQAVASTQSLASGDRVSFKPESVLATKTKELTPPVIEDAQPKVEEMKDSTSAGASSQGKDVRKGKKKKDFSRKEVSGSDMDAFIDVKENDVKETSPKPSASEDKPVDTPVVEKSDNSLVDDRVPQAVPKDDRPSSSTTPEDTVPVPVSKKEETEVIAPPVEPAPVETDSQATDIDVSSPALTSSELEISPSPSPAPEADIKEPTSEPERLKEPSPDAPKKNGHIANRTSEEKPYFMDDVSNEYNDENEPPKEMEPELEDREGSSSPMFDDEPNNEFPHHKFMKDGKLTYDRAYLMELRGCVSSQTKPAGLPNLDIILDRPVVNANRGPMSGPMDFTPSFFQPGVGNQRHAPPMGKSSSRGRQGPGDRQMPAKIIPPRLSMNNDVKPLHQSEKPWKPTKGEKSDKDKTLEAEALFIMNRLTPTNFEKLAGEMRKLHVTNYDELVHLVKVFFDKVTIETKFVSAYAQLCKVMSGLKVPPPPGTGLKESQATFRVVMLTKCQQEFEADKSVVFEDPEEKRKKLESEMEDTPERAGLIDTTLYKMKMKRLKFYGNIRFIGELFKLGMLTENIMHDCIYRLLKARDDDSLVSLCQLVATVGQNLDTDKAKTRMDQYFNQMAKIADERKSRIKFTLKDVIELRNNHWVPRKEQTGPKKIDEVHKDYEQEQARNQFLSSQPLPPRNDVSTPGSRKGSRQRQEEKPPNDDGWNTVGSRSLRIDASKMRLSKQSVVDENSIQLGPGGGMNKFSLWSRGSFGGAQMPSQDDRQAPPSNRFSALRDDKGRFERSPSRGDGRGMRQGPSVGHGRGKMMARSSQEGDRREVLASARAIVGGGGGRSQNSSRESSWNRDERRQTFGPRGSREVDNPMTRSDITPRPSEEFRTPTAPAPKKVKAMSEEDLEHKSKNILEEYLNIRDLAEAKLCVSELSGQPHIHLFVNASILDVLERNDNARNMTGQFLHELVKDNTLSLDIYIKGLNEVLQIAEDMTIDIPKIWTYLAQVISPMVSGGTLPVAKLVDALKAGLPNHCCARLLAPCVLQVKEKLGEDAAAHIWQSSGCSWSAFMPEAEVDMFLKDKDLAFTAKPVPASAAARVPIPGQPDWTMFSDDVEKLIITGKSDDDVIKFVEKTAGKHTGHMNFIRSLMTAIASSSIKQANENPKKSSKNVVNENVIKGRKEILLRYIKSAELELQALYAIQTLMTKLEHPSGVMLALFDHLYDAEVISEESCKQWEKSTDPAEQEGKGVCIMQLTQFFAWLNENEEPEAAS